VQRGNPDSGIDQRPPRAEPAQDDMPILDSRIQRLLVHYWTFAGRLSGCMASFHVPLPLSIRRETTSTGLRGGKEQRRESGGRPRRAKLAPAVRSNSTTAALAFGGGHIKAVCPRLSSLNLGAARKQGLGTGADCPCSEASAERSAPRSVWSGRASSGGRMFDHRRVQFWQARRERGVTRNGSIAIALHSRRPTGSPVASR